MSDTQKIAVIRQDAQVKITIGTAFIKRFQELSFSIISGKSEAEIDKLQEMLNTGQTEFEEQWMNEYMTVMTLLHTIDKAAVEQGLVDNLSEEEAASLLDS